MFEYIRLRKNIINNHNLSSSRKLIILINYSGKQDIVNSLNQIKLNKAKIDINSLNKYLVLSDIPDPELLIRTGGFQRISDFLLYNLSFTELFFTKKLWPDLKNKDLDKIIYKFEKIERKFGL